MRIKLTSGLNICKMVRKMNEKVDQYKYWLEKFGSICEDNDARAGAETVPAEGQRRAGDFYNFFNNF